MDTQKPNKKAILFFIVIIPLLTELLSGNTPITQMLNPIVFLFFIVCYSLPALIIRELFIRWRLGLVGLFVLGLAYGVFNEGVAARTLLLTGDAMFIPAFRGFSTFGFNIPWAFFIVPWHAFFAIVYPIVITHALYPAEATRNWLSKSMIWVIADGVALFGTAVYFSDSKYPGTPPLYLMFFWAIIFFLVFIARKIPQGPKTSFAIEDAHPPSFRKLCIFGVMFGLAQLLSFIWSAAKLSVLEQLTLVCLPYGVLLYMLRKKEVVSVGTLARLAVLHYGIWTMLTLAIALSSGSVILMLSGGIVWVLLLTLWKKIAHMYPLHIEAPVVV